MPNKSHPTIGIEFAKKMVTLKNGSKMNVQIWDTGTSISNISIAGQEKYKSICVNQYRDALGAILVFDLTRQKTFQNCKAWLKEFKEYVFNDAQIMLVGNKIDIIELDEDLRAVDKDEAANFAKENDLLYLEISAVSDFQVTDAFVDLLQEIYYTVNARKPGNYEENESRGFTLTVSDSEINTDKAEKSDCS